MIDSSLPLWTESNALEKPTYKMTAGRFLALIPSTTLLTVKI